MFNWPLGYKIYWKMDTIFFRHKHFLSWLMELALKEMRIRTVARTNSSILLLSCAGQLICPQSIFHFEYPPAGYPESWVAFGLGHCILLAWHLKRLAVLADEFLWPIGMSKGEPTSRPSWHLHWSADKLMSFQIFKIAGHLCVSVHIFIFDYLGSLRQKTRFTGQF